MALPARNVPGSLATAPRNRTGVVAPRNRTGVVAHWLRAQRRGRDLRCPLVVSPSGRADTRTMAITAPESVGTVTLSIDGRDVTAAEGSTIYQAARDAGIDIPVLCHNDRFDPVGVCRMCVVDVGAPAFAASCVRACENGMQVKTDTPELHSSRAMLTRLLLADQPAAASDPKETTTGDNELLALARRLGVTPDDGLPAAAT